MAAMDSRFFPAGPLILFPTLPIVRIHLETSCSATAHHQRSARTAMKPWKLHPLQAQQSITPVPPPPMQRMERAPLRAHLLPAAPSLWAIRRSLALLLIQLEMRLPPLLLLCTW